MNEFEPNFRFTRLEIPGDPQHSLGAMIRVLSCMAAFFEETQEQDRAA